MKIIDARGMKIIDAVEDGDLGAVKFLFDSGEDVTANDNYAVQCAVRRGHLEVVKFLVSVGADITADDKGASRRLSGWVKGLLATSLLCASQRRGASLIPVNAAYTSQMDSTDGSLTGIRKGDLFYCSNGNGDVLDADWNAARNILARKDDQEIGLFTPYREVKSILLRRTEHNKRLGWGSWVWI